MDLSDVFPNTPTHLFYARYHVSISIRNSMHPIVTDTTEHALSQSVGIIICILNCLSEYKLQSTIIINFVKIVVNKS